ncbi:MAG TPA: hypothetical protein VJ323_13875 [Bryobacteraceae bacterium]|jgi:hypothetical protein|nr:hypothetical protein [Bryobacteraceae bacterium]
MAGQRSPERIAGGLGLLFLLQLFLLGFALLSASEQVFRTPLLWVLGISMIVVLAAILKLRFKGKR